MTRLDELVAVEIRDDRCPSFESIVKPILPLVAGCAWAFEGGTPFAAAGSPAPPFPEDEELLRLFDPADDAPDRPVWELGWLRPGAIARMLPYVHSDWLDVYAVAPPVFARSLVGDARSPRQIAEVPGITLFLECVDAAFWRAWSPVGNIMAALHADGRARSIPWEQQG